MNPPATRSFQSAIPFPPPGGLPLPRKIRGLPGRPFDPASPSNPFEGAKARRLRRFTAAAKAACAFASG
jgi:hypothetical protein